MELPFPSNAVEDMIKFMYGTDLCSRRQQVNTQEIIHLVNIAEYCAYGALKDAALNQLDAILKVNQTHLCEILVAFKVGRCEAGFQACKDFIEKKDKLKIDDVGEWHGPNEKLTIGPGQSYTSIFTAKVKVRAGTPELTLQGLGLSIERASNLNIAVSINEDVIARKIVTSSVTKKVDLFFTRNCPSLTKERARKDLKIEISGSGIVNLFKDKCKDNTFESFYLKKENNNIRKVDLAYQYEPSTNFGPIESLYF